MGKAEQSQKDPRTDSGSLYGMVPVLVTGGAGFIGSHLVAKLVDLGARVTVLDNLSTGRLDNLRPHLHNVRFLQADVRDRDAVQDALRGCRVAFHLASIVSVQASLRDTATTFEVTAQGSLWLLETAVSVGCPNVVLFSSSAVYGEATKCPLSESTAAHPLSPYGAAKFAMEALGQAFAHCFGVHVVSLRLFNVYGPGQESNGPYASVIPRFMECLRAGLPPVIFGDGRQTRDFIFVEDVVEAALRAAVTPEVTGQILNIGSGQPCSILDLLDLLQSISGIKTEPLFEPPRQGDITHSCADINRARTLLGFSPSVSLGEGLALTWDWFSRRRV